METIEVKMMSLFCVGCSEIFTMPSRRGRPPKFCSNCRPVEDVKPVFRAPVETVVRQAPQVVTKPVSDKYMHLFCDGCHEIFTFPARRGRPPKYCTECIESGRAVSDEEAKRQLAIKKANEIVDRLEMMLKARGTHISQQKDWW